MRPYVQRLVQLIYSTRLNPNPIARRTKKVDLALSFPTFKTASYVVQVLWLRYLKILGVR